jgi:hypothetical protein
MPSGNSGFNRTLVGSVEPHATSFFDVCTTPYDTSFINHFSPNRPTVQPQLDDLDIKIKYRPVYACVGDLNA